VGVIGGGRQVQVRQRGRAVVVQRDRVELRNKGSETHLTIY